jgi:hypothetical protein
MSMTPPSTHGESADGDSAGTALGNLTMQLLAWIAQRPRSYAETMEAWRTTCPRLTVWEDALGSGFVQVAGGGTLRGSAVTVTARGRAILDGRAGA